MRNSSGCAISRQVLTRFRDRVSARAAGAPGRSRSAASGTAAGARQAGSRAPAAGSGAPTGAAGFRPPPPPSLLCRLLPHRCLRRPAHAYGIMVKGVGAQAELSGSLQPLTGTRSASVATLPRRDAHNTTHAGPLYSAGRHSAATNQALPRRRRANANTRRGILGVLSDISASVTGIKNIDRPCAWLPLAALSTWLATSRARNSRQSVSAPASGSLSGTAPAPAASPEGWASSLITRSAAFTPLLSICATAGQGLVQRLLPRDAVVAKSGLLYRQLGRSARCLRFS